MSVAGSRSWRGDEFQLCVALHYLIRLLNGELVGLQVESNGLPGKDGAVSVDDVVALLPNGTREYVQAKKNQPHHDSWKLKDQVLREELRKARDQLEADPSGRVRFYSRSPFGEFKKLQEEALLCPDDGAFRRTAGQAVQESLTELTRLLNRSEADTLALLHRMGFGAPREFDEWDADNKRDLQGILPSCTTAMNVLERFLASHQSHLRDSKFVISRADVLDELARHGLAPAPSYGEQDTLAMFRQASQIGRSWLRDIAGTRLPRRELAIVLAHIRASVKTVLVVAGPGAGKTCLLLDVAEELETEGAMGVLFVRGDRFAGVDDETRLQANGLPDDIIGRCARLAVSRQVVVLLDSLDVLSISRNHCSLRVFLGLLERLGQLDRVTVVAACREFDLKYDPQLRAREWQIRVPLALLSYAEVVEPLLNQWNIDSVGLSQEVRTLLCVPQHLRLFHRLVKGGKAPNLVSSFQLYERFVDEAVTRNPTLGDQTLRALEDLAASGMHQRRQTFPRASLDLASDTLQQLISGEILIEEKFGHLAFAHQTIAESLAVRKALREGKTLARFILDQPPLPFVRPTVRTFFFCLRSQDRPAFRRQAWEVLAHADIAYHLKRLIAESLAETQPEDSDWPLVRRLFNEQPTLFQRTFAQARGSDWFRLLRDHWLPMIKRAEGTAEWRYQYIAVLGRWLEAHPCEVVNLWTEALETGWAPDGATWSISTALSHLTDWTTAGLDKLFELLVANGTDRDMLSKPLSSWISAVGTGDKLLWQLMIRHEPNDSEGTDDGLRIGCSPHSFVDDGFLRSRLERSDELLTLVTKHLLSSVANRPQKRGLSHQHLHQTSWERRHTRHDSLPADGATLLIGAVEQALKKRAQQNDTWWQDHEPQLRHAPDSGVRYMLLQAYGRNSAENVEGIEAQLTDPELFRLGQVEYELGMLMADAYGHISDATQNYNQDMILALFDDFRSEDGTLPSWAVKEMYQFGLWIPRPFRSPRIAEFMKRWEDHFSSVRPSPRIHSWGGAVGAPISRRELSDLDNSSVLRILRHYVGGARHDTELLEQGRFVGGLDQVQSTLRQCAAHEPGRFLDLLGSDFDGELAVTFRPSIYEGIAEHLRYVSGSLSAPDGWKRDDSSPHPRGVGRRTSQVRRIRAPWRTPALLRVRVHRVTGASGRRGHDRGRGNGGADNSGSLAHGQFRGPRTKA
jgi:ATPase family associated with various cellular activities (AAA)